MRVRWRDFTFVIMSLLVLFCPIYAEFVFCTVFYACVVGLVSVFSMSWSSVYTGWAKKVIPLAQCNVMYERYHFFGPPCSCSVCLLPLLQVHDRASPVLTATGFVSGNWQFSTPFLYRIDTHQPITKKLSQVITWATCAKLQGAWAGRMGKI